MKDTSEVSGADIDYAIIGKLNCNYKQIIYIIECKRCKEYYVGESSAMELAQRVRSHLSDIQSKQNKPVLEHFNDAWGRKGLPILFPGQKTFLSDKRAFL